MRHKRICVVMVLHLSQLTFFSIFGCVVDAVFSKDRADSPTMPDELMLQAAASGQLGSIVVILFTIGIVAACFSSADSALTALTTSFCVDICGRSADERLKKEGTFGYICSFYIVYSCLPSR